MAHSTLTGCTQETLLCGWNGRTRTVVDETNKIAAGASDVSTADPQSPPAALTSAALLSLCAACGPVCPLYQPRWRRFSAVCFFCFPII